MAAGVNHLKKGSRAPQVVLDPFSSNKYKRRNSSNGFSNPTISE
jgi:hypothetical protein